MLIGWFEQSKWWLITSPALCLLVGLDNQAYDWLEVMLYAYWLVWTIKQMIDYNSCFILIGWFGQSKWWLITSLYAYWLGWTIKVMIDYKSCPALCLLIDLDNHPDDWL